MILKRAVLGAIQVRSVSGGMNQNNFERIISLYSIWKKYNTRTEIEIPKEPIVEITRSDRKYSYFNELSLLKGCPYIVVERPEGTIRKAKEYVKGYMRNAFVRGLGLQEDKQEFLELCNSTFFEILRAVREEDFSKLAEVTLGGNETLNFHRSAAHKLNKLQKEALKLNQDDLFGENGHIVRTPYLKDEMGPFIHSMDFTNVDAMGNTHPKGGENQGDKVFCRYKVMMGGVYKFDMLRNDVVGKLDWNHKILPPNNYGFKYPRYTIVELDIVQEAYNQMPIKLNMSRDIYDFHLYSF